MPETSTGLQAGDGTDWSGSSARSSGNGAGGDLGAFVSRVQLDETLSQVSDVVLTVGADGRIGYVSPAVLALLGYEQEDVLDRALTDLLDPDDAPVIEARLARGHGHHDVGVRVLVRHATDGWREVLLFVHAGPALDAAGYRAVVLRDAKDRGHTLDALRQRLAFEDLLTRVTSSFIHRPAHEVDECITDALADIGTFVGVDRVSVFVRRDDGMLDNTHEWAATGAPSEMATLRTVDPASLPEWMGTLERLEPIYIPRVVDQTEQWRREIDLLKPQGVRSVLAVPLADEGHLIGFIGFDLVERERIWSDDHIAVLSSAAGIISQALARSDAEQRFGLAFTNAPLGMVLSAPDGRHIQVNQPYCDLVGRTEEELIGRLALDLIHPDDVEDLTEAHREVVLGRQEHRSLEVRMVRPAGETVWLRIHISGVRGHDGKLRYTVSHVEDITVRHRQELELRASEQRYRTVVESSPAIIARFDRDRRLTYLSPAFESLTGIPVDQMIGHTASIFGVADEGQWASALDRVFSSGEQLDTEWEVPMPGGGTMWFQSRAVPERGDDGEVEHVLVMNTDITALKRTEAELAHQALHDPLTGLANRALLLDQLARILARRTRSPRSVGLLFLDLDRFKVVNDSLGHTAGDELLVSIAERLSRALRPTDTVARLGGDEFVVLIEDFVDSRDPIRLAERIHRVLKEPIEVDGNEVFATVSIGIAIATSAEDTAEGLLRDADAAMYLAKARGRDRYEIFDEELRLQATERLQTESHLRRAVELGEIEVYYQPELSLDTGIMVGAEALARWHHPVAGLLEAGAFIELAEDSGLILDLGEWVLNEACRQAGLWRLQRPDFPLTVRVNLSARQIAQPHLVDQVVAAMAAGGIESSALCLEITETALMSDPAAGLKVLQDLRALGVELAIDDFGTGYSSLSYLKRFPVDVLKIDRSFVDGLGDDPEDTAIVTAIISLGRALGLRVVAEGVETRRQLDELRRLGCDRAQGFMFARPRPAALLWESRTPYPVGGA